MAPHIQFVEKPSKPIQKKRNGEEQGQGNKSAKTSNESMCPWAQALVSAEEGA